MRVQGVQGADRCPRSNNTDFAAQLPLLIPEFVFCWQNTLLPMLDCCRKWLKASKNSSSSYGCPASAERSSSCKTNILMPCCWIYRCRIPKDSMLFGV